jgi:hypothetical protein
VPHLRRRRSHRHAVCAAPPTCVRSRSRAIGGIEGGQTSQRPQFHPARKGI